MRSLVSLRLKLYRWFRGIFAYIGLGKIPGMGKLDDFFYDKFIRPREIVLLNIKGNKMYVNGADNDITPKLIRIGDWEEKYESSLFKQCVKEGMTVVDVGAHVGYYTLLAARAVGRGGLVYAFEPIPGNYELLCRNIKANDFTNVTTVRAAVSNKRGTAQFWFEKDWSGSASFSKYGVLAVSRHETLQKGGFIDTETVSLDDYFRDNIKNIKIDILKIDTQGGEGLVMSGAGKILRNNKLKIFLEFWPAALRDLGTDPLQLLSSLQQYGYQIRVIDEEKQVLDPIEIDKAVDFPVLNLLLEN
jgi:FkbM family methyltransferase